MIDSPLFMLVNLMVTNATEDRQYKNRFLPPPQRYRSRFATRDDAADRFGGFAPHSGRMIMFKFPSEQQAKRWRADPEFPAHLKRCRARSQLEFLRLIRGFAVPT